MTTRTTKVRKQSGAKEMYLIESMEHSYGEFIMWWAPNELGYVASVDAAGRYTKDRAKAICANPKNERMWKESDVLAGEAGPVRRVVLT